MSDKWLAIRAIGLTTVFMSAVIAGNCVKNKKDQNLKVTNQIKNSKEIIQKKK